MAESVADQVFSYMFERGFKKRATRVRFKREDQVRASKALQVKRHENLGHAIYDYRYRRRLPKSIRDTAPPGKEWIIRSVKGTRAEYDFVLVPETKIEPRVGLLQIKVPDATPEIIRRYALTDEQSLLAVLRYNRLLDIFTGVATYSLQNHLRTTVDKRQVETDEMYVGVDKWGAQYVFPVQAKGGRDKLGRIQLEQDIRLCEVKYPQLICRAISAQFMEDEAIALFELTVDSKDVVRIVDERHYRLVSRDEITDDDLRRMRRSVKP